MKKIWIMFVPMSLITLIGCNNNEQAETNIDSDIEEYSVQEKENLILQPLKVDEEAGLSLEDNEFYQAIQAMIDADPKMGEVNDFSILPLN